jgi:hypothetical protein
MERQHGGCMATGRLRGRAQITIEFMMLVAIGIVFSLFMIGLASQKTEKISSDNEFLAVEDYAFSLQKEIMIASQVDDGYERSIELPDDINGVAYSVNVSNTTMVVSSPNFEHVLYIPEATGQFTVGQKNTIRNVGGRVYIN